MTRSAALIVLMVAIVAVGGSQLLVKARMLALSAPLQAALAERRIPWALLADPLVWLAVLLVGLGGASWYLAMTKLPLSLMLPVAAVMAPLVSLGAWAFLGETLGIQKAAAILVIAGGVAWLGILQE